MASGDTADKNSGQKGKNMELRELLGDELFSQVDAKIQEHNSGIEDKVQQVRFVDLSEGGYVDRKSVV